MSLIVKTSDDCHDTRVLMVVMLMDSDVTIGKDL